MTTPASTRWPAVAAALFAGVIAGFTFGKMSPALPLLREEFGLSLIETGWLVSAFNTLAVASAIFFGLFADRVGALRFCLFGVGSVAAGGLLGALSPGAPLLIASRLIEGMGFLSIVVSAPGLVAAATPPERRGVVFGLWSSYLPFGAGIIIAASPLLIERAGWRGLWLLVTLAALAGALLLAAQRRHYRGVTHGTARSLASVRAALAQPVPWWLGLVFAMYAVQNLGVLVWLPTYLLETRHIGGATAALLTALSIFVNCFGNVLGGWLIQRNVPRGRIIAVTFVLTSILFLAMSAADLSDGLRYALVLAYNVVTGTIPAAVLSAGLRYARSPAEVGTIQGLIVHITNIGIFFGPPLIAAAVVWGGSWDAALWAFLGVAVVGLAAAFVIGRYERAAGSA